MSIIDCLSLFIIMLVLAAIPSTSVALVVARSATRGIINGIAVAGGIVFGDLIFILLTLSGLSFLAETFAGLFLIIKYLGGLYLIWTGLRLLTPDRKSDVNFAQQPQSRSLLAGFIAGLLLTLGDIKAIVFYLSLFPAFIDTGSMEAVDTGIIIIITLLSVGGVKIAYAIAAGKFVTRLPDFTYRWQTEKIAGGFMAGTGIYIIAKP